MPRNTRTAVWLSTILNSMAVVTARYREGYDSYNHMFFADHYRLNWWSLWEPRWYTGFEVTSYPPLVHQLIGLAGQLIGVDAGYGLLLWLVLSLFPLAVYAFSRIFTGKTVSSYAALAAAVLPSILLAGHTFGQLPTLTGTLFALFGMAAFNEFLLTGKRLSGALAVALIGSVMASHHATLLFLPFAATAVVIHILLNKQVNRLAIFKRIVLYGFFAVIAGIVVIWPFWAWGRGQTIQTPIDHLSRHNFFTDVVALATFFLSVYGPLVFLVPVVLWKGITRRTFGLWAAFVGLFILGLGGTTPLPRLLFGQGWEWLTYDRFASWATLMLLPFFGIMLVLVRRRWKFTRGPVHIWRNGINLLAIGLLGSAAFVNVLLPIYLPNQPVQLDMRPIVIYLERDGGSQWRYITLGMGDQFAYLSRLTDSTTIDGSYHTARTLPELRSSGLAQIDSAYWYPNGMNALVPILQKSGERGVRWAFVELDAYRTVLRKTGWIKLGSLSNGVQVWENPAAITPPPVTPPAEDPLAEFSWGTLPLLSLFLSISLAAIRLKPTVTRRGLAAIQSIAVGLLPVGLCFWYFRTLTFLDHPKVYFTYDNALFFASDGLAFIIVLCWALQRFHQSKDVRRGLPRPFYVRFETWIFGLCMLAFFSVSWSMDWRTTLYFSLHLWFVFGLVISLRDRPELWRPFALGSIAALVLEAFIGVWQFVTQSTAFITTLGLKWPGSLTSADQGASVVQLEDDTRWLRVYGTLAHPNILGGVVFVLIAAVAALYLLKTEHRPGLLLPASAGVVLLVLTFSRSAGMALAVFLLLLVLRRKIFERMRLAILVGVVLSSLVLVLVLVWPLIFARSGGSQAGAETFSVRARTWLAQETWQFIREKPLYGLGAGSFIIELARRASYGYIVEPVHNIPLLVTSELGLGGLILLTGLIGIVVFRSWSAIQPGAVIFSALLAGLGVISLFDHYLWTLAPGRVMLGAVLGLWAGQMRLDDTHS